VKASRRAGAGLVALGLLVARGAAADDTRALREQAEAEMALGSYAEACPLLVAAYAADHATTTRLASARCFDGAMKLASAHAAYTEVLARADATDADRKLAQSRAAELGPRLSRVTVRVPPEARVVPGARVTLDGQELPPESWDLPHPRDAGKLTVAILVPGTAAYTTVVNVPVEGGDDVIDLPAPGFTSRPALAPAPAPRTVRVRLASRNPGDYLVDTSSLGPWQIAGASTAAVGTATSLVGLVVALLAKADHNRAQNNCTDNVCGDRAYVAQGDLARDQGNVATAIGVTGLGLVAVGAGLYFLGPRPARPQVLSVAPRGLGLSLGGSF